MKRYTFYRAPTGKPYRGTDGKHAPVNLLADIGKTSKLNPEGSVQWQGFFIEPFRLALRSSFVIIGPDDEELNENDVGSIVWGALVDIVKRNPGRRVNPLEILAKADELAAAFFRKPFEKFVVVSSLSVANLPAKIITISGCSVTAMKTRGRKWPLPSFLRDQGDISPFASHVRSTSYRLVKVTTQGRSMHEAIEKGLNALNLLRGLWSLIVTRGSWAIRFGGRERKPIGVIHSGPIHTLHHPDGRLFNDELYWYDPDYTEDQRLFEPSDQWHNIEKQRNRTLRRMATFGYRRDLEDLLIRYAVALDQPNPSVAFLQMWSILEKITDTVGSNYDETIKRTIWLFSDEDQALVKDMLESLRYRRNKYVHSGASGQQADQAAYMIKSFVDPHLANLVHNPFKVRSLEEYGQFLSLPTDIATLKGRRQKLGLALSVLLKGKPKK
jgi:hypothetical protein